MTSLRKNIKRKKEECLTNQLSLRKLQDLCMAQAPGKLRCTLDELYTKKTP